MDDHENGHKGNVVTEARVLGVGVVLHRRQYVTKAKGRRMRYIPLCALESIPATGASNRSKTLDAILCEHRDMSVGRFLMLPALGIKYLARPQ
jgi:hypothetical protein